MKNPAKAGLHLGPLPSRAMAHLVVDALHSAVPLRRCTQRLGRNFVPADDAPVEKPLATSSDGGPDAEEIKRAVEEFLAERKARRH